MRIAKGDIEICSLEDWGKLAPPEKPKHWADGRSAKEFARAWFPSEGRPTVPAQLSALFAGSAIGSVSFIEGEPEARLRFDTIRRKRQIDLAAKAVGARGLIAITIEAKERETFDRPVGKRLDDVAEKPSDLPQRIEWLSLGLFGTTVTPTIRNLYYQLLYGTAATLCFAENVEATMAAFIVFEFQSRHTPQSALRRNQKALDEFVDVLTQGRVSSLPGGKVIGPVTVPGNTHFSGGLPLYLGKAVCLL